MNNESGIHQNGGFGLSSRYVTDHYGDMFPRGCFYSGFSYYMNFNNMSQVSCSPSTPCICKRPQCQECPRGKYSAGGINAKCISCPANKPFTNNTKPATSILECTPTDAVICQPGHGSSQIISTEGQQCTHPALSIDECRKTVAIIEPGATVFEYDGYYDIMPVGCVKSFTTSGYDQYHFNTFPFDAAGCSIVRECVCKHKECQTCFVGKFSQGTFNPICKPCPKGYYCPCRTESRIFCISGTKLEPCGVGKYGDIVGLSQESHCKSCPAGKYGGSLGKAVCNSCPEGQYSNTIGATSVATCQRCGAGTYTTNYTGTWICFPCPDPEKCLGGKTCTDGWKGLACTECEDRYYSTDGKECVPCPENSIGAYIALLVILYTGVASLYNLLSEEFADDSETDKEDEDTASNNDNHKKASKGNKDD